MKTILSFLLIPILAIAQPMNQFENEYDDMAFSMEINTTSIAFLNQDSNFTEPIEAPKDVFTFETNISQFTNYEVTDKNPPQFLSSFSFVGLSSHSSENTKPQERLNLLLASNDIRYPKENTLVNWLNPVRYTSKKLGGVENMVQGFGPLIKF